MPSNKELSMGFNRGTVLMCVSIVCFLGTFFVFFIALRNVLKDYEPIFFGFNVLLAFVGLFLLAVADQAHKRSKRKP